MRVDVVGVGYPVMDCLIRMDRLPVSNGASNLLDQSWQGGGMIATGLVTLAVLGGFGGMIGVVGDDSYGEFCKMDLTRNQVDVSHLTTDPNTTTFLSFVLSESEKGARSFVAKPGSHRSLRPEDLDEAYIAAAKYLLVTVMDSVTVAACRLARKHGVKVLIDADEYDPRALEYIALIDVFLGSEDFYQGMSSEGDYRRNCKTITDMGPEIAMFTLGARGCVGLYHGKYLEVPAFKVKVMDTTGAGDVFHGAFLYALLQGWDGEKVVSFANAVAAIKCTRLGGRAGLPEASVVERFIETGEIDYTRIDQRVQMYRKGMF